MKPFKFIELVARVKNLLRRAENSFSMIIESENTYNISDLQINDDSKTVTRNEKIISLTSTEYRLLLYFVKHKNKVLSRIDILEEVWGVNFDLGTNVVDVYVNYLRKKIDNLSEVKLIHTVIGMGYVMKEN